MRGLGTKALLSVYDKTGLADFGRSLADSGCELISTGRTHAALADAGIPARQVSDLTGFPEILDGRVKTLHPVIYGGILSRRDLPDHAAQIAAHNIAPIDIVAVNLYPFVDTVTRAHASLQDALENIDIGGPAMIRAAAKNFPHVIVIVDPADYAWLADRLARNAPVTHQERRRLARKAFQHVALYDAAVSQYLGALGDDDPLALDDLTLGLTKLSPLRYGENPHQQAALYAAPLSAGGIVRAKRLHGIDMSYTNYLDADAAWRVVSDFAEPAAAVIKHTNPCGLALHPDQPTAYRRAFDGDPVSAYGGIVAFNRPLSEDTAQAMRGVLFDIIIAPDYDPQALAVLRRRRRTRVLQVTPATGPQESLNVRLISGGALVQQTDALAETPAAWRAVTERKPDAAELADLAFAWRAAKHIKSNTIVLAKDNALVGMGAGQPNRVVSVHLARRIAGDKSQGSVLASDAFFPFPDNIQMAAEGGITAIAQPGGSIRDDEVIAAANDHNIAMVFTGTRHFLH